MGIYNKQGDIIEICIRDNTNRRIEQFKANLDDKKLCRKIISIIEHKYDLVKDKSDKTSDNEEWLNMDNDFFK